uniref:Uncharacterized protein n=1 Tax=Paramoeba aestuarina TaxID=180227 RepID=A0A7S4PMH6_9EUKA|mmetsp:Transcript_8494/g.12865  ORF Transcript_8494/g.12865 Transcript_8494/m.12865 type:complete len:216 (+) Transcript_8494:79-726(+)|eukprot:CAMPEP_0201527514 /NCGR_PEP_ID=MMETSP0161_2-20130828/35428_1 /ASSEMBLY_ACC=CAM_ASM_000251 /TAXON_ID=180227 /ORGANISM="Neoparamoeba aestuarina, Strain SoJaBio B1-5/56/2" /LENGTH=215 /DNA_ID=CAMNT_0047928371 /DNA_START=66 /DNA_END=713 /DNA_ORIENTATION=-
MMMNRLLLSRSSVVLMQRSCLHTTSPALALPTHDEMLKMLETDGKIDPFVKEIIGDFRLDQEKERDLLPKIESSVKKMEVIASILEGGAAPKGYDAKKIKAQYGGIDMSETLESVKKRLELVKTASNKLHYFKQVEAGEVEATFKSVADLIGSTENEVKESCQAQARRFFPSPAAFEKAVDALPEDELKKYNLVKDAFPEEQKELSKEAKELLGH